MKCKTFEIRDAATFIPVLAVQLGIDDADNESDRYLLKRAGYGGGLGKVSVVLYRLVQDVATASPYRWPSLSGYCRTMETAHKYITHQFDNLRSGDVIDVEFILGETPVRKNSERDSDA